MKALVSIGAVLLVVCLFWGLKVYLTQGAFAPPQSAIKGQSLYQTDASDYVQRMAATIQDRADCQQFKDEFLAQGQGSPYNGKTMTAIVNINQAANQAGCKKSS